MKLRITIGAALVAAVALVVSAGAASAQVSSADAKCRAAFDKTLGKYNATIHKTIAGCWKDVLKGKRPSTTDCNTISTADNKGKVGKAETKLDDTIGGAKTKCDDSINAAALAEFAGGCPSPAAGPIASWVDARNCAKAITEFQAEQIWDYTFNPTSSQVAAIAADKNLSKCAGTIHKGAIKLSATTAKERGKAQQGDDKAGTNPYNFLNGNADPKTKIAGATTKLNDGIVKACSASSVAQLANLASCRADVDGLQDCLDGAWTRNGSGVTSMAYEQAGICPTTIVVAVDAGTADGARLNPTNLNIGWTGLGHNADVVDGFEGLVASDCSGSSNSGTACDSCVPTLACDPDRGNCRCSNDVTTICDTPNGPDANDCGGNVCTVYFGPPLPLNASNTPVCAVNTVSAELVAVVPADIGTGSSTTDVSNNSKVYLGISQSQPCPTCVGDPIANDLVKGGTCDGGANNGGACDANGLNATFGDTSYDCQPSGGQNVSGAGLGLTLRLTDGTTSLAMGTDCTIGGGYKCACAVCTGDPTVPCNSNSDCSGVGGTCTSIGSGVPSAPNSCGDLVCGGSGTCTDGTSTNYCDGYLAADGSGVLTCTTNADCVALAGECPGGDCGNCTVNEPVPCFTSGGALDLISVSGSSGTDGAVLATAFCSPPTSNGGVNGAAGSPGPATGELKFRFTGQCANGTAWQFPGGSNCQ